MRGYLEVDATTPSAVDHPDPLATAAPLPPAYVADGPSTPSTDALQAPYDPRASFISSTGSDSSYGSAVVHRTLFPPGLVLRSPYSAAASNSSRSALPVPDLVSDRGDDNDDHDAASLASLEESSAPVHVVENFDLSDSESDDDSDAVRLRHHHPAARRLPRRRDLEFVRHSASVSSMQTRSSRAPSEAATQEEEPVVGGPIQQWQIDMINEHLSEDGADEGGDADFALRKLEGRIDSERQRAKMRKVDGWLQAVQKRMADGGQEDFDRDTDDDEDEDEEAEVVAGDDEEDRRRSEEQEIVREEDEEASEAEKMLDVRGMDDGAMIGATTPMGAPVVPTSEPALPVPDVQPIPTTPVPQTVVDAARRPSVSRVPAPPHHQSFVLVYKSEAIAQHLAIVDRELFIAVRFEEIVVHDWEAPQGEEDANPADWAAFIRARRALGRAASDVTAVKARFNIVVAWVASELALSHPGQRAMLAAKFIRIAWVRTRPTFHHVCLLC